MKIETCFIATASYTLYWQRPRDTIEKTREEPSYMYTNYETHVKLRKATVRREMHAMYNRLHVRSLSPQRPHSLLGQAPWTHSPGNRPHFEVHVLNAVTDAPPADGESFLLQKMGNRVGLVPFAEVTHDTLALVHTCTVHSPWPATVS